MTDSRVTPQAVEAAAKVMYADAGGILEGRWQYRAAEAERILAAAAPLLCQPLQDEIDRLRAERDALRAVAESDETVGELRDLWQRALEREGNLASAVADLVWKATQYGETEDGDTFAYIVPKGTMHRLVGVAQSNGAHVPVAFRAAAVPVGTGNPTQPRADD